MMIAYSDIEKIKRLAFSETIKTITLKSLNKS